MNAARTRSARGFTLPEVLAALVIVGVVLPVAMWGITTSLRVAADARSRGEATQLARQKLDELLADRASGTQQAATSGTFDAPFEAYSFQIQTGDAGLNTTGDLSRVDCTVKWVGQGSERAITLTTLVTPETETDTDTTTTQ